MLDTISLPRRDESIDARLLTTIIQLYLDDKLRTGAIKQDTAELYLRHLAPFVAFWEEHAEKYGHRLSPSILQDALRWIRSEYRTGRGERLSRPSVATCFRRLRQVFNWAYANNCTGPVNLASWCPDVSESAPRRYFPTLAELQRMFDVTSGEYRLRDIALMAFLLSTGARQQEAALAQVGALEFDTPFVNIALGDDHRGTCHLRRTKGDMAGEGNGRYVVFDSPTGLLLKIYLRSVGRSPDTTPDEPIFGMTGNGIRLMIERHRTEAGLPEISAHAFRRAFADYWDEHNGPELRIVLKKQLGHSVASRDVTELHYINQNPRRAAREIMQHHISPMREIRIDWRLLPVHIQEVVSGA